jgi:hypothetical protein
MDATGSMGGAIQATKEKIGTFFERALDILREEGIENAFELQFCAYRNYSSQKDILQKSTWETKAPNLRAFLTSVDSSGGQGNEAIEMGLWHVNREIQKAAPEDPITQVILIGDMPPNTESDVHKKRAGIDWCSIEGGAYAQPTHFRQELETIKAAKIPVCTFFVKTSGDNGSAIADFQFIATETGGKYTQLDVDSEAGVKVLTDWFTQSVLKNIGKASGDDEMGRKLVGAYQRKYGGSGYVA